MSRYKIVVEYKDGDLHTIPDLSEMDLLAWLISFVRADVLRDEASIKSFTISRKD